MLPFDWGWIMGASPLRPSSWDRGHSSVYLLTSNAPLRILLQILTHPLFLWLCVYVCIKASLSFHHLLSLSVCLCLSLFSFPSDWLLYTHSKHPFCVECIRTCALPSVSVRVKPGVFHFEFMRMNIHRLDWLTVVNWPDKSMSCYLAYSFVLFCLAFLLLWETLKILLRKICQRWAITASLQC